MSPARWPREAPLAEGLVVVDPRSGRFERRRVGDLPAFVRPGDLVVVNDAATLPASLRGQASGGEPIEARLLASRAGSWRAVLFGAGDWRTRTEDRPPPPRVSVGEGILFGGELPSHPSDARASRAKRGISESGQILRARVESVSESSPRLVDLFFEGADDDVWAALYRHGRPVQYSYVAAPLALWHVQTPFAGRPWASEMPSAARPLAWELILALRSRGVRFASLTHAAGLSATGDPSLDAALPLRESFDVPVATVAAVRETRSAGGRVVAVGTSVVRALESVWRDGGRARSGETDLRVDGAHALGAVDALFTGMHEPGTSHDALLHAFAPSPLLTRAYEDATRAGFLGHEFGDSMLILPGALESREARAPLVA